MKTLKTIIAAAVLGTASATLTAIANDSLEPCINGNVSALGLHASQAGEDTSKLARISAVELEPCINGEVSATGTHPTQAQEDGHRFEQNSVAGIDARPDQI